MTLVVLSTIVCAASANLATTTTTPTVSSTAAAASASDYGNYRVRQVQLGGRWEWSLSFSQPPYMYNNYINEGAAIDSYITDGNWSAILAGSKNIISSDYTVIGGGGVNTASGEFSTIRGGLRNTAKGSYSVINGGAVNKVHSNYGTILGGYKNTVKGRFGTVLGGGRNTAAGRFSVAAGFEAKAMDDYSAVFGFNDAEECMSKGEFSVRFCAGYVTFGDGDYPTDLLKVFSAVDKSRRLSQYDEIDSAVQTIDKRLQNMAKTVQLQNEILSSLQS
eukprot:CAMPEP_0195519596 /NCGR_PEP_ID=MMETSP0794_2-20130614/15115_1 /TAXON_ID=515487 /ORGANISM="Stephanopyxis turris, Strain CCMP 815" /LENGTH=275 /DNA_ID=CAMNT_0040648779 /DNA_START=143 /DNA_END=970 /DNA_ORIENTATION=+